MDPSSKEQHTLLGEVSYSPTLFSNLDDVFSSFYGPDFFQKSYRKRFHQINQALAHLLLEAVGEPFLLPACLHFIERVNQEKLLDEPFRFTLFEFWLNNYSELNKEEKWLIRCKLVGKYLPREAYQLYFPIGMRNTHPGSHFVVGHLSPDIDTTIASFFGWLDAFGAQVAKQQHLWNLPGGAPDSYITMLFKELFGATVFQCLARPAHTLTLTAMDLLSTEAMNKYQGDTSTLDIDHGNNEKAAIYVDEEGYYLGDWRAADVEQVRPITNMFKATLHWFENNFHVELITLFSKKELHAKDISPFISQIFEHKLLEIEPLLEFGERLKGLYLQFLQEIFGLTKGAESTFGDLFEVLASLGNQAAKEFRKEVERLQETELFLPSGQVKEDRPLIFSRLELIIKVLDIAIQKARAYIERLDVVMKTKQHVLEIQPQYLLLKNDVEEIRGRMRAYDYLTVVIPEQEDKLFPVGIVRSTDLQKSILGTVSFRDFSNFHETKMASYLSVISVIDHHKIDLKTDAAPQMIVGDAQSCNTLVAEKAFLLNDRFSSSGMTTKTIESALKELGSVSQGADLRKMQRLITKKMSLDNPYWVNPIREYAEYLCFLHAILDDTDLLTKVTPKDVECVATLLNRMKSIAEKKEVEVVDLTDLPKDASFTQKASDRILKNNDMYSIYKRVYEFKEKEVEANILLSSQGLPSNVFNDTKEQNGCCRVGQTKMFSSNFPTYEQHRTTLLKEWLKRAEEKWKNTPEIDLHLHMISTIKSADEVHQSHDVTYTHKDEIWLWIPGTQSSQVHLARFLSAFQNSPEVHNNDPIVEMIGDNFAMYEHIFQRNFFPLPMKNLSKNAPYLPLAILKFYPGTLNSRKSMITPYLPRLLS